VLAVVPSERSRIILLMLLIALTAGVQITLGT
jgi:hypothetical protein